MNITRSLRRWFDSHAVADLPVHEPENHRIDWLRIFAITGFDHHYYPHRGFKTSRATQFVFALLGITNTTQTNPQRIAAGSCASEMSA